MLNKFTILCVDDEPEIIELFSDELEDAGFNVLKANGGEQAFKIFQKQKVDLILSDIRMPDGDGVNLVKNVKLTGSQIPIYLITGFSDYSNEELNGLGISGLIFKPFDLDEIISMVEKKLTN